MENRIQRKMLLEGTENGNITVYRPGNKGRDGFIQEGEEYYIDGSHQWGYGKAVVTLRENDFPLVRGIVQILPCSDRILWGEARNSFKREEEKPKPPKENDDSEKNMRLWQEYYNEEYSYNLRAKDHYCRYVLQNIYHTFNKKELDKLVEESTKWSDNDFVNEFRNATNYYQIKRKEIDSGYGNRFDWHMLLKSVSIPFKGIMVGLQKSPSRAYILPYDTHIKEEFSRGSFKESIAYPSGDSVIKFGNLSNEDSGLLEKFLREKHKLSANSP